MTIALVIAGLAVVDAGLTLAERWLSSRIGEGLIYDLRLAVFSHVQRMPLAFFTRTRTGSLVSRLNNDVIGAQRAFTSTLSGLVTNSIQLVLAVVVMVALAWQVTLLALVLLPIFILPARRMGRRIAALQRESADLNASMTGQMTERFSAGGATLVKLFGRPQAEADEFGDRADRVRAVGVRTAMVNRVFLTCLTLVSALAQALVYGLGGWLAVTGTLDAGTVVGPGAAAHPAVLAADLAGERPRRRHERARQLRAGLRGAGPGARRSPSRATPTPLPAGPLGVRLHDVRFTYPSASEVSLASLEEVARLDDRGGARGPARRRPVGRRPAACSRWSGRRARGSRRSPRCCPRLYDVDSGAVEIGGRGRARALLRRPAGRRGRRDPGRAPLPRHRAGQPAPTRPRRRRTTQLREAMVRARLGELLDELPAGLDTVVGERGHRLSGGERQRLTIARLLLASPRVVILDEATAHLDSESEYAVQEALAEALVGRTAVVIAHRLSTVRAADTIAVVEHGRVVEQGTHDELLARGGRYADLYHTQFAVAPDARPESPRSQ